MSPVTVPTSAPLTSGGVGAMKISFRESDPAPTAGFGAAAGFGGTGVAFLGGGRGRAARANLRCSGSHGAWPIAARPAILAPPASV